MSPTNKIFGISSSIFRPHCSTTMIYFSMGSNPFAHLFVIFSYSENVSLLSVSSLFFEISFPSNDFSVYSVRLLNLIERVLFELFLEFFEPFRLKEIFSLNRDVLFPCVLYSCKKSSASSVFGVFPAYDEADRYASLYSRVEHSPDSRDQPTSSKAPTPNA